MSLIVVNMFSTAGRAELRNADRFWATKLGLRFVSTLLATVALICLAFAFSNYNTSPNQPIDNSAFGYEPDVSIYDAVALSGVSCIG